MYIGNGGSGRGNWYARAYYMYIIQSVCSRSLSEMHGGGGENVEF